MHAHVHGAGSPKRVLKISLGVTLAYIVLLVVAGIRAHSLALLSEAGHNLSDFLALLLSLAPETQLRGMLFWLIGDLGGTTLALPALITLAVVLAASLAYARDLNVLSKGADTAAALGVAVGRTTLALCALSAFATAAAVTTAGSVGFVGLVVPHALRLVVGNDQRMLLPASALAGGALLVLADTLARTIAAPIQLPVGVITALIGVPVFLVLLTRGRA